jgi:hypothetical protein
MGCNGSDAPVKTQAPSNPSGKPRNEKEAQIASDQEQAGARAVAQEAKAAAAMRAAKARAGGQ